MVISQISFQGLRRYLETRWKQGLSLESNVLLKVVWITIFMLSSNFLFSQSRDSIFYVLPAEVKSKIVGYLNQNNQSSDLKVYVLLAHQNDTTQVMVSHFGASPKELLWLVKNTNRFLRLKSNSVLPVLLKTDLIFSDALHKVENEESPYATFTNKYLNVSGYIIDFYGMYDKAQLIKAEYYQN